MYFGEIGKRYELNLTLKREYSFVSHYGYREQENYIYTMEDENGNVFVWKTTSVIGMDDVDKKGNWTFNGVHKNDSFKCKATVKDHSEYKGTKQTVLTRVKVLSIDHVPTKEELDEIKRAEQLKSLKEGDVTWQMPYKQYKEHYSDCETLAGSYLEADHTVQRWYPEITVIIRAGRLVNSGVRFKTYKGYEFTWTDEDGKEWKTCYRAVSEENAEKRFKKEHPEAVSAECTKIYDYKANYHKVW